MPNIVVMDRELHEALTIVRIPFELMPGEHGAAKFLPLEIRFEVPEPEPFYKTPFVEPEPGPVQFYHRRVTSITLERVMSYRGERWEGSREPKPSILFWYAYANDPELALLLRAAFLPGQVGEMQMQRAEAEWNGVAKGFVIGLRRGFDEGRRSA